MRAAPDRGWLGWLRARYEITPDRVTVTRSWMPALLIAGLPLGAWLLVKGLNHPVPDPDVTPPMIAGFIAAVVGCLVLGTLGMWFTPWFGPQKIVCTSEGIAIGRHHVTAADVASIGIEVTSQRGKGPPTHTVFIAVQSRYVVESFRMPILWSSTPRPQAVIAVIDAMRRVLAVTPRSQADDGILLVPP